jgi:predicted dehydrogenase
MKPAKVQAFADRWGIPRVHDNWQTLLADPDVDAVELAVRERRWVNL